MFRTSLEVWTGYTEHRWETGLETWTLVTTKSYGQRLINSVHLNTCVILAPRHHSQVWKKEEAFLCFGNATPSACDCVPTSSLKVLLTISFGTWTWKRGLVSISHLNACHSGDGRLLKKNIWLMQRSEIVFCFVLKLQEKPGMVIAMIKTPQAVTCCIP